MLRKGVPRDGGDYGIRAETRQMDGGQSGDLRLGGRGSSERACYCGRLQQEAGRGAGKDGHVTGLLRCEAVGQAALGVLDGNAEGDERWANVLVKRIRGNAPATVAGFGDGRFNPHIRGHPPAAVKGLRRALVHASCRVFDVNEHMTSQVRVNFLSVFSGVLKYSEVGANSKSGVDSENLVDFKNGINFARLSEVRVNFEVGVNSKNGVNSGIGVNFDNTWSTHKTSLTLNGMVNSENGVNSKNVVDYGDMVNTKRHPR
jgi:hypothetical protein